MFSHIHRHVLSFLLAGSLYVLLVFFVLWDNPVRQSLDLGRHGIIGLILFGLVAIFYLLVKRLIFDPPSSAKAGLIESGFAAVSLTVFIILLYEVFSNSFLGIDKHVLKAVLNINQADRLIVFLDLICSVIYFSILFSFNAFYKYSAATIAFEHYQTKNLETHLSVLNMQMSPHYLFNNLNALSSLIHSDQNQAIDFVHKLIATFDYILANDKEAMVPLQSEIEFLNAYLHLLKIRFRDGVKVSLAIDKKFATRKLPPLTLQMLVENAVKHNVISKKEPLNIFIRTIDQELIVINNLQPRDLSAHSTGVGIKNITQRYLHLTGKQVKFEKTETQFIARIPFETP